MPPPTLEFHYDISCPFAYIASTRVESLSARTQCNLLWRPVLLGAIYRATSAPQGAAGSASDVFNPTKKAVTAASMQRTLTRYKIPYRPPPQHPRKTVDALRLLYHVPREQRPTLSKALFKAYWVEGRDVADRKVLLEIARESDISGLTENVFVDAAARKALETATNEAIERGAIGVPSFWLPEQQWTDLTGTTKNGRLYWGQDRMHFVEAALLSLQQDGVGSRKNVVMPSLRSLMPRCIGTNAARGKVRVEFWYDFSSPWAFLGWTQLERLQRTFGKDLQIDMKPFLLGALFRDIGAPNLPMAAVSQQKAIYSRHDHQDWVLYWNAVNAQEGSPDKPISFQWAENFPIRTPTVLRVALVDPSTVPLLYRACWEQNQNVSSEPVLFAVLCQNGYDGPNLIQQASAPEIKEKLRHLTTEAKEAGLCGVPSYRVFRTPEGGKTEVAVGGVVWGQDETNVVEDLIAGWDGEGEIAEVGKAKFALGKESARL